MDTADRIEQGVVLAVLVILALVCVSMECRGDDGAYWKAKAAATIAIKSAVTDLQPPKVIPQIVTKSEPTVTKPDKVATKSVVTMYTATWCEPCQRAKATLKSAKLPFEIRYVDVSNGGQPSWCESIPMFAWDTPTGTLYCGWNGVEDLIGKWRRSERATVKQSLTVRAHWSHPPDLAKHLQYGHGVSVEGLSHEQQLDLHDRLHEGR